MEFYLWDTEYFKTVTYNVVNGEIVNKVESQGPNYPETLIKLEEINIDSPEALKKAKKDFELYPGKHWAKGYHFTLGKENNILHITVVGENSNEERKYVTYNVKTGDLIE